MFVVEEHSVPMGRLAHVKDRDARCGHRSPKDHDNFSWSCTREFNHPGVHRGGYSHSNEENSYWGAEWDNDRESDLSLTKAEVKALYGR